MRRLELPVHLTRSSEATIKAAAGETNYNAGGIARNLSRPEIEQLVSDADVRFNFEDHAHRTEESFAILQRVAGYQSDPPNTVLQIFATKVGDVISGSILPASYASALQAQRLQRHAQEALGLARP